MSATTKKKHVCREVLDDLVIPEGNQEIVRVVAGRGNNLHEVVDAAGNAYLVSMPTKFRKNVWIKRGDFLIVEPIEEGDKVQAEILSILYRDQIRHIKKENLWPSAFDDRVADTKSASPAPTDSDDSREDAGRRRPVFQTDIPDDMLPPSDGEESEGFASDDDFEVFNPNRQRPVDEESSSEEEDDDQVDDDEESTDDVGNVTSTMNKFTLVSTQASHCQG